MSQPTVQTSNVLSLPNRRPEDDDFEDWAEGDRTAIARALRAERVESGKSVPGELSLARAITGLTLTDTIKGSSTLEIKLIDEGWDLVDSDFLDAEENGKFDKIDVNYPKGSRYWWRVTQVGIEGRRGAAVITLTLMERAAAWMMDHKGPVKARRGKVTRAEFIAGLVKRIDRDGPGLKFLCENEHVDPANLEEDVADGWSGRILYIGDSLGEGTAPFLKKRMKPPIDQKTKGAMPSSWGEDWLARALTSRHGVVVFDMGTNDGNNPGQFIDRLRRIRVKIKNRLLVLLTMNGLASGMNDELREWVDNQTQTTLIPWRQKSHENHWVDADGIHPFGHYGERAKLIDQAIPTRNRGNRPPERENGSTARVGSRASNGRSFQSVDAETVRNREAPPGRGGIPLNNPQGLTIKGVKANRQQINHVNIALDATVRLKGPELAYTAMIASGIGESDFKLKINPKGYGGVFQGQVNTGGHYFEVDDTDKMARHFMLGGKGFADGAIHCVRVLKMTDIGEIAKHVEVSDAPDFNFYSKYKREANRLIAAYGGLNVTPGGPGGGPGSDRATYNFEVGARENYWDAMTRLADEVGWALFLDGNRVYYDPETSLIQDQPIATLRRSAPSTLNFSMTWDQRRIATEMNVAVVARPFDFRAGQVVQLEGFGPGSTGSTPEVKLPGRWLIEEIQRDRFSPISQLTLKQPAKPKPEPEASSGPSDTDSDPGSPGSGDVVRGAIRGSPVPNQRPHAASHETSGLPGYPAYDYMAPAGTPCVAPVDGKITRLSGKDPSQGGPPGGALGYSIYMSGGGKSYFLTHLDKVKVKAGQRVKQGEQIAQVADGPSSWSSPHVHMGVHG